MKRTVNFDDPGTYHLYYGDGAGTPGSILTFFPYVGARQGRHGVGQAAETRFAVPRASIGYWVERLMRHHVPRKGRRRASATARRCSPSATRTG